MPLPTNGKVKAKLQHCGIYWSLLRASLKTLADFREPPARFVDVADRLFSTKFPKCHPARMLGATKKSAVRQVSRGKDFQTNTPGDSAQMAIIP